MSITQIIHTPHNTTVPELLSEVRHLEELSAGLLEKARALEQQWAEREADNAAWHKGKADLIGQCRRELREAFGIEETKNMENK